MVIITSEKNEAIDAVANRFLRKCNAATAGAHTHPLMNKTLAVGSSSMRSSTEQFLLEAKVDRHPEIQEIQKKLNEEIAVKAMVMDKGFFQGLRGHLRKMNDEDRGAWVEAASKAWLDNTNNDRKQGEKDERHRHRRHHHHHFSCYSIAVTLFLSAQTRAPV